MIVNVHHLVQIISSIFNTTINHGAIRYVHSLLPKNLMWLKVFVLKVQLAKPHSHNPPKSSTWLFLHTPKLLDGLIATLKVKTAEGEGVGARSLTDNTLGVEGCDGAPWWGLGILTSNSITHMDLHKWNNKLVSA
jgi:hypothetical protein